MTRRWIHAPGRRDRRTSLHPAPRAAIICRRVRSRQPLQRCGEGIRAASEQPGPPCDIASIARFRIAKRSSARVTCVIIPKDIQERKSPSRNRPHAHDTVHSGIGVPVPHIIPKEARSSGRRRDSSTVARKWRCLVGQGALGATDEVISHRRSSGFCGHRQSLARQGRRAR